MFWVMKISIVTIFPDYFPQALEVGILGRALDAGLVEVELIDLRDYAEGVHRAVDDAPFGGGAGMVMTPEPLARLPGGQPPGAVHSRRQAS